MADISTMYLDIIPAYVPFVTTSTQADGTKINPTSASLIVYEEDGLNATQITAVDNIVGTFTPVIIPTDAGQTGFYSILIPKSNFSANKFYIFLYIFTVDAITTHKVEVYFFQNSSSVKADVSNLDAAISTRAPASEYDTEMGRIDAAVSTRATPANITAAHIATDADIAAVKVDTVSIESKVDDTYDNTDDIEAKVDLIQTDTTAILADTNEVQGKLPTNEIMGSSVKTDKDDEIDAILADTVNIDSKMPSTTIASESNATVNKDEIITKVDEGISSSQCDKNFNTGAL